MKDATAISEVVWPRITRLIEDTIGLHFPRERRNDLFRGLCRAAEETGTPEVKEYVDWLLSVTPSRADLGLLATHLTIGETYFFRERRTLEVLAEKILPELIVARRMHARRLRLWSAACCTGEEAYTLAILLSQVLPDIDDWQVTILATDINDRFLQKAMAGIYTDWSFRDTPPGFRDLYFDRTPDGRYAIRPQYKHHVRFANLNLAEDSYPSLANDTNAMDIIFCRNALMYFTPAQTAKIVANFRRALITKGWLAVSPSEASQTLFAAFRTENFPGAILYRKTEGAPAPAPAPLAPPPARLVAPSPQAVSNPIEAPKSDPPLKVATRLYQSGDYAEAAATLLDGNRTPTGPGEFAILARTLANYGQLTEAMSWCERWLAADRIDASAHYFHAVILQELGQREAARQALQKALFLRPEFALAHFELGVLARASQRTAEADRHFANALAVLAKLSPGEALAESDGLTAGRLAEIVASTRALAAQS